MKWVKPVGFRGHGLSDSLWMSQLMMLGINKSLLFTTYTKWLAVGNPVRMIGKGFEWRLLEIHIWIQEEELVGEKRY